MAFNAFREDPYSFEQYNAQEREISTAEAINLAFSSAFEDTGVGLLSRKSALAELEERGGKSLQPEDANALYPDMPVPFREPVKANVAGYLYQQHLEKEEINRKLSTAPTGIGASAGMFGAGLLAHFMDPLEVGISAAGGWLAGRAATAGLLGERVALAAKAVNTGLPSAQARLLKEGVESLVGNVAENVLQESVITDQAQKENQDYQFSVGNVAVGTLAGTALHIGIKEFSTLLRPLQKAYDSLSPGLMKKTLEVTEAQMKNDVYVAPEHIANAVAKETDVPNEITRYQYVPFRESDGRKFYIVEGSGTADVGDSMFGGRQVTDNPGVANVVATRSFSDSTGLVSEVEIGSNKILNINEPFPKEIIDQIGDIAERAGLDKEFLEQFSGKDVLDFLQAAAGEDKISLNDWVAVGKKLSNRYDALLHDGSTRFGAEHGKHNVIEQLNDVLKPVENTKRLPDPLVRRLPDEAEKAAAANYINNPENRTDIDIKTYREDAASVEDVDVKEFSDNLDKVIEAQAAEISALNDLGLIDDVISEDVDGFNTAKGQVEYYDTLNKVLTHCVGKG